MANERDTTPNQKQSETNTSSSSTTDDGRRAQTDASELDDDDDNAATGEAAAAATATATATTETQSNETQISDEQFGSARMIGSETHNKEESSEKEEELHRQRHKARVRARKQQHHQHCDQQQQQRQQQEEEHRHHHHRNHHHHRHHKQPAKGHIKELIKPDPTVREKRARIIRMSGRSSSTPRSPPLVADSSKVVRLAGSGAASVTTAPAAAPSLANSRVAIAVDEEQLQRRLLDSISERKKKTTTTTTTKPGLAAGGSAAASSAPSAASSGSSSRRRRSERKPALAANSARQQQSPPQLQPQPQPSQPPQQLAAADVAAAVATIRPSPSPSPSPSPKSSSSSSSSDSHSHSSSSHDADDEIDGMRSPPPAAIIIPPSVAKSLSNRARQQAAADGLSQQQQQQQQQPAGSSKPANPSRSSAASSSSSSSSAASLSSSSLGGPNSPGAITREQLAYGPLLRPGEVQVLYRSPDADLVGLDRHLKEEQAKLVAPNMRQSPIAIMSMNPTYELQNRPLVIEYPATVENLRLNNTGFSWEVKIPYQISMATSLFGAHLSTGHRYRLDQFHCHWGADDKLGSEHTVDNNHYSAELHFVHYNMEKYHTLPKAARHPDGLVVLSVFLDARDDHHNHAELEKIVSHLRHVPLKGGHSIIKQAVHIENLLPLNRSYWSYQGSLTTPPYFESVTWFIFKHPIRCNRTQIQRFRNLKSSLRAEEGHRIETNHRKTQPLNGRTIVNYDESNTYGSRANSSRAH